MFIGGSSIVSSTRTEYWEGVGTVAAASVAEAVDYVDPFDLEDDDDDEDEGEGEGEDADSADARTLALTTAAMLAIMVTSI